MHTFTVSAYYHRAERNYTFGPFKTEEDVEKFIAADTNPQSHEDWWIDVLNPPESYGTGQEVS